MKTIKEKIKQIIIDLEHPVGSIYANFEYIDPSTIYGGTWEQIKDVFLLACGDTYSAGSTGGEATHNHELTEESMAGIRNYGDTTYVVSGGSGKTLWEFASGLSSNPYVYGWTHNKDEKAETDLGYTGVQLYGNTGTTSNMPPYTAIYVWKRVA